MLLFCTEDVICPVTGNFWWTPISFRWRNDCIGSCYFYCPGFSVSIWSFDCVCRKRRLRRRPERRPRNSAWRERNTSRRRSRRGWRERR